MPHPVFVNRTAYAFEALLLADEEGVAQFVPCVQASWHIGPQGALEWIEEQPSVAVGGQWRGDPATTSLVLEPQIAFTKPGTDVVLIGHAHAPRPGTTESTLGLRVGPLQKTARVFGDRRVVNRLGRSVVTAPEPFERIPIVYERAFGGWDLVDADPSRHRVDPRNPVGVGFRVTPPGAQEQPLPNFEDPKEPYANWGDTPPPVGFGFIAAHWQPRAAFGGTYDEAWARERKPLLPKDFDRRFFNAASPGLASPAPLRGDEPVVMVGASSEGRIDFALPGVPPPACFIELRGRRRVTLETTLDTVVFDMDERRLTLTWRAGVAVRNGVHDVVALQLHADAAGAQAARDAAALAAAQALG